MKRVRVFVASPGDVAEERDVVSLVVNELRRILSGVRDVELETIRWETHAWPDVGADAQDVINREITEYDIFVGIMWRRFGTPTKRAESGTREEFDKAYGYFNQFGRPKIMFYFRRTPFYPATDEEIVQFRKIIAFRQKLEDAGVLFWEYDTPLNFERNVREHLARQIIELTPARSRRAVPKTKARSPSLIFMSAARDDLPRVRPVYDALNLAGFKSWLDVESLLPGQDWSKAIQHAISNASAFLFFVSRNSINREGWLVKETRLAVEKSAQEGSERFIVPVRLDPVEPPPLLSDYQWVDIFESGGLERLITALRATTARPTRRKKR